MSLIKKCSKLIKIDYPKDIAIDGSSIAQMPIIIQKYMNAQFDLMYVVSEKEMEKNKIYGERFKYYKEDYNFKLSSAEVKYYIAKDTVYVNIVKELEVHETLFKQIVEIITELRNVQWMIKTSIEYKKFEFGIN
jgi:hypothetical protein